MERLFDAMAGVIALGILIVFGVVGTIYAVISLIKTVAG